MFGDFSITGLGRIGLFRARLAILGLAIAADHIEGGATVTTGQDQLGEALVG